MKDSFLNKDIPRTLSCYKLLLVQEMSIYTIETRRAVAPIP